MMGGMAGTSVSDMSTKLLAAIVGLILIGLWTQLYPVQNAAADQFYLTTQPKCEIGNEPFTKLYPPAATGDTGFFETRGVTFTQAQCTAKYKASLASEGGSETPDTATTAVALYTEHNQKLNGLRVATAKNAANGVIKAPSSSWGSETFAGLFVTPTVAGSGSPVAGTNGLGGTWEPVLPVVAKYGVITRQVIAIIPVVGVASIIGISASSLYAYGFMGQGNIVGIVVGQVVMLVVYVVGLIFAPQVMEFFNGMFLIFEYERFSINVLFNVILTLIMGFSPIIYAAGLLGGGGIYMGINRGQMGAMRGGG